MSERKANIADFRLSIAGVDFTAKARPRLVSLSLTEKRGEEADQLEIVLDDSDGKLAMPSKGAVVALQLGWKQGSDVTVGLVSKGTYTVDDVSWAGEPDQITIRARSANLAGAFRVRREKGYRDTTLGAIAQKVAAANGLTAKVAPSLAGIPVHVLIQHHQSDMALLRRLGREHDAVATVKSGKLILSPIGQGTTTSGKALASITLTRADGSRPRYSELDRSGDAGVEARWHDQDGATRKTVKVGGGKGTPHRLRKVYHSETDARAAAQAANNRGKRAEAEFEMGLALGRPTLTPEQGVKLVGFKAPIDARSWILSEITHRLDQSGFITSIKLEAKA